MNPRSVIATAVLALGFATPAFADITVLPGPSAGALDPVALDGGPLDPFVSGTVGPDDVLVAFTGAENLVVQGQRIEAALSPLNFLLFGPADPALAFTAAQFNLNALADGVTSIFAYDQFGNAFGGVFDVSASGNNIFSITALDGQLIRSVVIQSTADLGDVRQIRLGGLLTVVPEPSSWALMILGFAGAGAALRARRDRLAKA